MSKEYRYHDLDPILEVFANTSTEHDKNNVRLVDYLADLSEDEAFEDVDQNTIEALAFALGYFRQLVENRKASRRIAD
ncbi:MAG: hypothetical protein IPK54_10230 [Dokdonella sp.]|uniref:hypothetical protein n=1 Tax=Dokdonella sp. TaxID=2291710 RepID=UPI0025BD3500|nr:hypothetical protein [Dokdonella sp.]MBK8123909.1 hypothetical protein [Dokdonella sp.]